MAESTEVLLDAWREAVRAAERADRLAREAVAAADLAETNATAAEEIAELAEAAATLAARAAHRARQVATSARKAATFARSDGVAHADQTAIDAATDESTARDAYDRSEEEARKRHPEDS